MLTVAALLLTQQSPQPHNCDIRSHRLQGGPRIHNFGCDWYIHGHAADRSHLQWSNVILEKTT